MDIKLNRGAITRTLALIALVLVLIHSAVLGVYFYIDDPDVFDFVRLIDLDYEGNFPTLYSVFLFVVNGVLFWLIYRASNAANDSWAKYWFGLAIIFVYLGIDEGTRFHEEIGDLTENFIESSGYLYFPWVVPYMTLVVIAGLIYLRFFLSLSRDMQRRLIFSAVLFIGGAVGVEMISANQADLHGTSSISYSILYTIEESLEMAGLLVLANTLLLKLENDDANLTLKFGLK